MSATTDETTVLVPLRSWIENEEKKTAISADQQQQRNSSIHLNKKMDCLPDHGRLLYGIAELLILRAKNHASATNSGQSLEEEIRIDNFAVCVCNDNAKSALRPWEDIKGVSMLSPSILLEYARETYV
ncbi:hypothetical protein QTG54_011258 [Skeletonema marinoi]|uniref:Uncharacterized protein n=1 Tax=Skeletonema marinoi TaxID=267567 RepID=A0AAD8Y1N4_9STRA|nr:hypothetical protein QTG54_011258 [Skeletonema marinoi]